jgi:hypothetical protein
VGGGGKYLTELIVEGKLPLDQLPEPYLFLVDDTLNRLVKAINIVAAKGYRVVSMSESLGSWTACMEKKEKK